MSLLKSASEQTHPVWFVIERDDTHHDHSLAHPTREAAMNDFDATLIYAMHAGEAFTPYARGRRLVATGPDWVIQPDDHTDPLLVGDAALHAVLTETEYAAYVQAPVAAALLES